MTMHGTKMDEDEILAHAEALANMQVEGRAPTESDFARAESEVRKMLADGATYTKDDGWRWN